MKKEYDFSRGRRGAVLGDSGCCCTPSSETLVKIARALGRGVEVTFPARRSS